MNRSTVIKAIVLVAIVIAIVVGLSMLRKSGATATPAPAAS